ncbi:MAG: hypothetical protein WCK01_03790 [Candidatus Uhrbacteria bacterium]
MSEPKKFPKPPLNVIPFHSAKPRRRDETVSYETERKSFPDNEDTERMDRKDLPDGPPTEKVVLPKEQRITRYSPVPGKMFNLFTVHELKAGDLLQQLFSPVVAAFIILRGIAEELVPDVRGTMKVIRRLEPGDMVNTSLFATGADTRGAETETRAITDLLVYMISEDDLEALDVSEEKRAATRRKRERFVQAALSTACIRILQNRNTIAEKIENAEIMAEGANLIAAEDSAAREVAEAEVKILQQKNATLEKATLEKLDRLKEIVIKPLREEIARMKKDREADLQSLGLLLGNLEDLFEDQTIDQNEKRLAQLVAIVSDALQEMSISPDEHLAKQGFRAMNALFNFKMKPPKSFNEK